MKLKITEEYKIHAVFVKLLLHDAEKQTITLQVENSSN